MEVIERHCPVCSSDAIVTFFTFDSMPIANNVLCKTYVDALHFPTGNLHFIACENCGFIWNIAFDPCALQYNELYENNQSYSQSFLKHLDDVIDTVPCDFFPLQSVEVGCGQGYFVQRIVKKLGNDITYAIGFDPALRTSECVCAKSMLFSGMLDSKRIPQDIIPNFFITRHVVEHIHDINDFFEDICVQLPIAEGCLIETPSASWIIKNKAFYDMYYEHCSLFSEKALKIQLEKYGFSNCIIKNLFDGQYMVAVAKKRAQIKSCDSVTQLEDFCTFQDTFDCYVQSWEKKIKSLQMQQKKVAIWGAASKGVTFIQYMHKKGVSFDCVIDINPHKHGCYIPCVATPIVSPKEAVDRNVDVCIVANPVYMNEVTDLCQSLSWETLLLALK